MIVIMHAKEEEEVGADPERQRRVVAATFSGEIPAAQRKGSRRKNKRFALNGCRPLAPDPTQITFSHLTDRSSHKFIVCNYKFHTRMVDYNTFHSCKFHIYTHN